MRGKRTKEQKSDPLLRRCLAAAAAVLLAGCATVNVGTLQDDPEAAKTFEAHRVMADHAYYVSGTDDFPDGLLAIDKRYRLRIGPWRRVEMTPELMRKLVANMNWAGMHITEVPVGAVVLGPDGERIGLWYSDINFSFVELLEGGEVRVQAPASIRDVRRDLKRSREESGN